MENITLEKIIKFDNTIVSLETLQVSNDLKYELLDDDTHAKGYIDFKGNIKTMLESKDFNETVDVDIFAPFEKHINREEFKIEVKDYSYIINDNKLIVYFVISLTGFKDNEVEEDLPNETKEQLLENINTLNETIKEDVKERNEKENNQEDVKERNEKENNQEDEKVEEVAQVLPSKYILKNHEVIETIKDSWATDLFKLSENYTVFMKIHKE